MSGNIDHVTELQGLCQRIFVLGGLVALKGLDAGWDERPEPGDDHGHFRAAASAFKENGKALASAYIDDLIRPIGEDLNKLEVTPADEDLNMRACFIAGGRYATDALAETCRQGAAGAYAPFGDNQAISEHTAILLAAFRQSWDHIAGIVYDAKDIGGAVRSGEVEA